GLLPTYPNPALAACLFVYPFASFYAGAGVFVGSLREGENSGRVIGYHGLRQGDEVFLIAEAGITWTGRDEGATEGLGAGRVAIGGHYNTGDAERFSGGTRGGTGGVFGLFEQQLSGTLETDEEEAKGAFFFVHAGLTDKDLALVYASLTAGLSLKGTFADRPDDVAGVLVSHGLLSSEPGADADGNETAIEVFYGVAVTPWLTVKPDLQYIVNPGGSGLQDALVSGVQVRVSF
ncbi:MAG: carbohydrate porin, partial [Phycisphaerales bacterium]